MFQKIQLVQVNIFGVILQIVEKIKENFYICIKYNF